MSKLTTVPTFTFNQGGPFNMDGETEKPIHVDFYNGCIVIRQDGIYSQQEEILIHPKYLKAFCKEIQKHLPEAEHWLNRNTK